MFELRATPRGARLRAAALDFDQVVQMRLRGMTITAIAKELKVSATPVLRILERYKARQEQVAASEYRYQGAWSRSEQ